MFIIAETWRKVASIQKVIYAFDKFRQSARGAHIAIKKECVTMQHLLALTEFPKLPPLVSKIEKIVFTAGVPLVLLASN